MRRTGFTLLEVLIAMSMTGCVLSALLLYQMNSLRAMHHVFLQTIAFIQLENFSEMICTTPSSFAHDQSFLDWDAENKILLPHGSGAWRVISNHRYFIQMTWSEKTWQTKSIDVIC